MTRLSYANLAAFPAANAYPHALAKAVDTSAVYKSIDIAGTWTWTATTDALAADLISPEPASGAGSGDVTGPASALINRIALFADSTGKVIKDSGTTVTQAWLAEFARLNKTSDPLTVSISGASIAAAGVSLFAVPVAKSDGLVTKNIKLGAEFRAAIALGAADGATFASVIANSLTSKTGSALTLATLDSNANLILAPHGSGQITTNNILAITRAGIGVTSTQGLLLQNTTAAAAGAQQYSPAIEQCGRGWKTDATAASMTVCFRNEVRPVQGAAAPTGLWMLSASVNAAAYSDWLSVSTAGQVSILASTASSSTTTGALVVTGGVGIAESLYVGGSFSAVNASPSFGNVTATQRLSCGANARSITAWGTNGQKFAAGTGVTTDTSTATSATVAIAVFSSFAVPVLATTNTSITYTDVANVYIAGAPTAGANTPTLTRAHALWLVGPMRWDQTVTTETVTSDCTIPININGTAYKVCCKA